MALHPDSPGGSDKDVLFSEALEASAKQLITILRSNNATLATAESCTGGLLSGLITSIAGASDVFGTGFVTYANAAKTELLGVPSSLIERHGAVSSEVATAMAEGARHRAQSSLALAITGIAGPNGGSAAKPVGLVYIGLAMHDQPTAVQELRLGPVGRNTIRMKTIEAALAMALASTRQNS